MACALPYHATLHFVRLVQTARLAGPWEFLAPMQASGAPLPRASLAQRCLVDASLLERVCQGAQAAAAAPVTSAATWMSFYATLVCEVIGQLLGVRGVPAWMATPTQLPAPASAAFTCAPMQYHHTLQGYGPQLGCSVA